VKNVVSISLHLHKHSNAVLSLILYGHFQIFTENSFTHITFNPHTHKTPFLPFILRCVRYFSLAFDLLVTWQQQQHFNSLFLKYVEAILL